VSAADEIAAPAGGNGGTARPSDRREVSDVASPRGMPRGGQRREIIKEGR